MAEATLVHLRGATLGYGRTPVLSGVELVVAQGDHLGIVGPNGSGKTTLLLGLLGLLRPLAGERAAAGVSIGYVPQRESLDPVFPLTVDEVVHQGGYGRLRGFRAPSRDDRRLAGECLERVALGGRGGALFSELSGGQRQRVLLARALMAKPRLVVLDEPTSGVDARTSESIHALLDELNATEQLAICHVSHQLLSLREHAREVVWVADGGVQRGPADAMLSDERLAALGAGGTP